MITADSRCRQTQCFSRGLRFLMLALVLALAAAFGPPANAGVAGKAVALKGSDYLRTTLWSNQIFQDKNFTFELWFNAVGPGVLIGEPDTADVRLWDYSFAEVFPDGVIKAGVPGVPAFTVGTVQYGTWHHLALVYNQSASTLSAYLDGQLAGSSKGIRTRPADAGRTSVYAFGRGGPTNLGGGNWFSGKIEEVRIWNRALSAERILASYDSLLPLPDKTGLFAYWHLDTTAGNISPDASGNNNASIYVPVGAPTPLVDSDAPLRFPEGTVQTRPATVEPGGIAHLNALGNPGGSPMSVYFQWGPTTLYGNTTITQAIGSGSVEISVETALRELPNGDYHFRAVGISPGGLVQGADQQFSIAGPAGKAITLRGNDYIRTTLWSPALFKDKNFTFELWFSADGPGVLVGEPDTANVNLWDYSFAEVFPDGIIKVGLPGLATFTVGKVGFGDWHHLALTYDQNSKVLSAYLDGKSAGSSVGVRKIPSESGREAVYAFGRGGPTNLGGGNWFTGKLDEIRIWNRPLGADEIAGAYDKLLSGAQAGLFGYWHFDSATGNLSPDSSPKSNPAIYVPVDAPVPLAVSGAKVTEDLRPVVLEQSANNLNPFVVELAGSVNPQGLATLVYFEYGRTNFDQSTGPQNIGQPAGPIKFSSIADSLVPGATYSFRVVASNSFGIVRGPERSFLKTGWAGYSLSLNGTNHHIRTTTAQDSYFPNETITVEFWFKPKKAGVLAGEYDAESTLLDRSILEVLPSGDVEAGFAGLTPVSLGHAFYDTWNHVALRYDKGTLKMDGFLNGKLSATSSGDRSTPAETGRKTYFAFGKSAKTKLGTGDFFGGELDEIKVWRTARTDIQLQSERFNLAAGDDEGLVFYWQMDKVIAPTAFDGAGNNNNGLVVGAAQAYSDAPVTLSIVPIRRFGGGTLRVQFSAAPDRLYRLEATDDFKSWTGVATNTAAFPGVVTFATQMVGDHPVRFFRVMPQ